MSRNGRIVPQSQARRKCNHPNRRDVRFPCLSLLDMSGFSGGELAGCCVRSQGQLELGACDFRFFFKNSLTAWRTSAEIGTRDFADILASAFACGPVSQTTVLFMSLECTTRHSMPIVLMYCRCPASHWVVFLSALRTASNTRIRQG